jgi:hypothetical protein
MQQKNKVFFRIICEEKFTIKDYFNLFPKKHRIIYYFVKNL